MALCILILRAFFSFSTLHPSSQLFLISLFALTGSYSIFYFLSTRRARVYVVNYGCFNPPSSRRAPFSFFMEHSKLVGKFNDSSLNFQNKILHSSGLSQLTCLPSSLYCLPPKITIAEERRECESALFGAMDELLATVHVKPQQIGVIVTNCSVFSPTPSMTSIIVQKYKLPIDVKSFNLSGMGCSAGLLALDLAKRVLLAHPNKYALVLSTENLTRSWYYGNERSMLVTNCLFRVGASAVLLSNKSKDREISKYRVLHTTRSHIGANDKAYKCVYQEEDSQGLIGVRLSKDLINCASLALEHNIKMLGPKVLPTWEMIMYISNVIRRKIFYGKDVKPYIPKFRLAFENICIHAGGKAVIQEIEKRLDLPFRLSEPSYMTWCRYGNLSSASVWYELAYEEAKGKIKKGNKVWQIGIGGGFKCCSAVLEALMTIDNVHIPTKSCWAHCIRDTKGETF